MTTTDPTAPRPDASHRISAFLHRRPRLRLLATLSPPLAWLLVVYVGSLVALLIQSFFRLDDFTGLVDHTFSLDTWRDLLTTSTVWSTTFRTVLMALAVTIAAAALAMPLGYWLAKVASPRAKALGVLGVLLPLWASYLVRVYSWSLILAQKGVVNWFAVHLHLGGVLDWLLRAPEVGGTSLGFSLIGQFLVFLYVWLPYMVLPVQASLERVPDSYLEASADLGAGPATTFRRITWPLAKPGVVAGSIFTFSLTLGDYIIPALIGSSRPSIGKLIQQNVGATGNLPLAAALSFIPMVIMGVYLTLAKRAGAFEAL